MNKTTLKQEKEKLAQLLENAKLQKSFVNHLIKAGYDEQQEIIEYDSYYDELVNSLDKEHKDIWDKFWELYYSDLDTKTLIMRVVLSDWISCDIWYDEQSDLHDKRACELFEKGLTELAKSRDI